MQDDDVPGRDFDLSPQLTGHSSEYVAWGWTVKGFASVIGSLLTTVLAMTFGFRVVLVLAIGVHLVALACLRVLVGAGSARMGAVATG